VWYNIYSFLFYLNTIWFKFSLQSSNINDV
jgi:hypothetical protein